MPFEIVPSTLKIRLAFIRGAQDGLISAALVPYVCFGQHPWGLVAQSRRIVHGNAYEGGCCNG